MIPETTPIAGLLVIHLEPADEESEFLARYYCAEEFAARA
jgi:hypothetical protein